MAMEIVSFPIENGGSFHSLLYVYQRVCFMLGRYMAMGQVDWIYDSGNDHPAFFQLWLRLPKYQAFDP